MSDRPRYLYVAIMAVVMFYAIHETGRVVFAFDTTGAMVNASIDVFMLALAPGLRSGWPLLYVLGGHINRLVSDLNGGKMPVYGAPPATAAHGFADANSRLTWFSDWIYFWGGASSIGDILIVLSLCATLWIIGRRVFTSPPSAPSRGSPPP